MDPIEPIKNLRKVDLGRLYIDSRKAGKLSEYYLVVLRHMRDEWKDDLPDVDVRTLATLDAEGMFVGDNYKCRGNFIVGLSLFLQGAIDDRIITDPPLIGSIGDFKSHDFRYEHGEFTTREEIDMMNNILNGAINHIEPRVA